MKSKPKPNHKNEESKLNNLKKRILEEKQTLFLIVHDEAHAALTKDNLIDKFINAKELAEIPNIIFLQVSATPYSLITINSRIPEENRLPWFTTNDASEYFGTKDFVQTTQDLNCDESDNLVPGAMVVDYQFEQNVQQGSPFEKYLKGIYKKCLEDKTMRIDKSEKNDLIRVARLHGLVMQYMMAILEKANIPPEIYEHHFKERTEKLSEITKEMLKDIDSPGSGEGKMILLRVIERIDGICFAKVLRKMRALLNLDNSFSIVLDIDSEEDRSSGMECFKNEEAQFLPRLQCWNAGGNTKYGPRSYKDLKNLPVILIVCERGKLGITYPTSLRYYDLRIRYNSLKGVTRGAIEQDFGRACRYKNSDDLPTILVSRVASTEIFPRKRESRKRLTTILNNSSQSYVETSGVADSNGVHKLTPDYPHYMKHIKGTKKNKPCDDLDLSPYKSWFAGKRHCDKGNLETYKNRYLLVGRPQIGKTGAFLHLAFLIWDSMKRPECTGPIRVKPTELIEWDEDFDEAKDDEHFGRFPLLSHIKSLKLQKPCESKRYGDPNDPAVQKWYLEDGKTYPFPKALEASTSLTKRMQPNENHADGNILVEKLCNESSAQSTVTLKKIYNKFCAKPLTRSEVITNDLITNNYYLYEIKDMGLLLRNRNSFESKWENPETLNIHSKLKLPPIMIPSSGRESSALLDLRETMEGCEYIQILIIRLEEATNYLKYCIQYKEIDILVIKNSEPKTVGASRYFAKKLGERITSSSPSKYIFLSDDNILCWTGVTLINDPCPLFDKDPNCQYSQGSDISLLSLLSHMALDDYNHLKDFSIIGFSLTRRTIKSRLKAYGRKHVFGAVLLNLSQLQSVEYKKIAWAMEDIDFNWSTDKLSNIHPSKGVIVKCMRYVGCKTTIKEGGVVPRDIPDEIFPLIKRSQEWNEKKEVKEKLEPEKEKNTEHKSEQVLELTIEEHKDLKKKNMESFVQKGDTGVKDAGTLKESATRNKLNKTPQKEKPEVSIKTIGQFILDHTDAENYIRQKDAENLTLKKENEELRRQNEEKDIQIEERDTKLEEKDAKIEYRDLKIEEKDAKIEAQWLEISKLKRQIKDLHSKNENSSVDGQPPNKRKPGKESEKNPKNFFDL